MSTTAQKAFFISLAAFARSTAALLDEMGNSDPAAAATAPATAAPKPAAKKKEEPKAAETTVTPAAKAPVDTVSPTPSGDVLTQARAAAKGYAEVYGREGLVEVLKKYTTKTLADVPLEKLPDLLKELTT